MRIAVLSNSHAAALAYASRSRADGADLTFFAADGGRLHALAPDGAALVPQNAALEAALKASSGGLSRIDAGAFDAFVVYALGFIVRPLGAEYSSAVRTAALTDRFSGYLNAKLVALVREVTDKPILCAPTPLRAHQPALGDPAPQSLLAYDEMLEWTERHAVPAGVRVVGQPRETRDGGFWTKPAYNVDAPKLTAPGDEPKRWAARDVNHMNADFGALMLETFEGALSLH